MGSSRAAASRSDGSTIGRTSRRRARNGTTTSTRCVRAGLRASRLRRHRGGATAPSPPPDPLDRVGPEVPGPRGPDRLADLPRDPLRDARRGAWPTGDAVSLLRPGAHPDRPIRRTPPQHPHHGVRILPKHAASASAAVSGRRAEVNYRCERVLEVGPIADTFLTEVATPASPHGPGTWGSGSPSSRSTAPNATRGYFERPSSEDGTTPASWRRRWRSRGERTMRSTHYGGGRVKRGAEAIAPAEGPRLWRDLQMRAEKEEMRYVDYLQTPVNEGIAPGRRPGSRG